jgi:hypothetical protein
MNGIFISPNNTMFVSLGNATLSRMLEAWKFRAVLAQFDRIASVVIDNETSFCLVHFIAPF